MFCKVNGYAPWCFHMAEHHSVTQHSNKRNQLPIQTAGMDQRYVWEKPEPKVAQLQFHPVTLWKRRNCENRSIVSSSQGWRRWVREFFWWGGTAKSWLWTESLIYMCFNMQMRSPVPSAKPGFFRPNHRQLQRLSLAGLMRAIHQASLPTPGLVRSQHTTGSRELLFWSLLEVLLVLAYCPPAKLCPQALAGTAKIRAMRGVLGRPLTNLPLGL